MARIKAKEFFGKKIEKFKQSIKDREEKKINELISSFESSMLEQVNENQLQIANEYYYDDATDTYVIDLYTNADISELDLPKGYIYIDGKIMGQETLLNKATSKSKIRFNVVPLEIVEEMTDEPEVEARHEEQEEIKTESNTVKTLMALEVLNDNGILNNPDKLAALIKEYEEKLELLEKENKQETTEYYECSVLASYFDSRLQLIKALEENKEKFKDSEMLIMDYAEIEKIRTEYDALIAQAAQYPFFESERFAYKLNIFVEDEWDKFLSEQNLTPEQIEEIVNLNSLYMTKESQQELKEYIAKLKKEKPNMFGLPVIQEKDDKDLSEEEIITKPISDKPKTEDIIKTGGSDDSSSEEVEESELKETSVNNALINYLSTLDMIKKITLETIGLEIQLNNLENSLLSNSNLLTAEELKDKLENINSLNKAIEQNNNRLMNMKMKASDIEYNEFIMNNYCIINEPQVIQKKFEMDQAINNAKHALFTEDVEQAFIEKNSKIEQAIKELENIADPMIRTLYIDFIYNLHNSKCRYANNLINYTNEKGMKFDSTMLLSKYNYNIGELSVQGPIIEQDAGFGSEIFEEREEIEHKPEPLDGLLSEEEIHALLEEIDPTHESELEKYRRETLEVLRSKPALINTSFYEERIKNATDIKEIKGLRSVVELYQLQYEENQEKVRRLNEQNDRLAFEALEAREEIDHTHESELEKYRRQTLELLASVKAPMNVQFYEEQIKAATDIGQIKGIRTSIEMLEAQYTMRQEQIRKETTEVSLPSEKENPDLSPQAKLGFVKDKARMAIERFVNFSKSQIKKCIEQIESCQSVEAVNGYFEFAKNINDSMAPAKPTAIEMKSQEVIVDGDYREIETIEQQQDDEMSFSDLKRITGIDLTAKEETKKPETVEPKKTEKVEYQVKEIRLHTIEQEPIYNINHADAIFEQGVDSIKVTQAGQRVRIEFTKAIMDKLNAMKVKLKRIESAKGTEIYGLKDYKGVDKEKIEDFGDKVKVYYDFNDEEHVAEIEYGEKTSGLKM